MADIGAGTRVAFLGPLGTFTEQALLTQSDLAQCELVPVTTIPDIVRMTAAGKVDLGFVPVENAIEGTVNAAMDTIAFEADVLIQREVVLDIRMELLALKGTVLADVRRVVSYPVAISQVRTWLRANLPNAEVVAANSTAEAARIVGEAQSREVAAVGNLLSGSLYDLAPIAGDIGDHPENQTRFVVVKVNGIPRASGHDKTSLVVYQKENEPGSLLAILQEFAARKIDLVKLESRPTRKGLGNYCFLIDFVGHVSNEVVADCLIHLKANHGQVKFLGSYPVAGPGAAAQQQNSSEALVAARAWIAGVRTHVEGTQAL
jgi:prephenate dehydratase